MREEFGQQAPFCLDLLGRMTVDVGIDAVQTMGQYGYGGQVVALCFTVAVDIDAIGQSAHDECIGAVGGEIVDKLSTELLAVVCSMACTHHSDYM